MYIYIYMMLRQGKQRHFCCTITHSVSSQSCLAVPHQHQAVAKTEDEGLCHPQTQHHHPKPRRPRPQPTLPSLPTTATAATTTHRPTYRTFTVHHTLPRSPDPLSLPHVPTPPSSPTTPSHIISILITSTTRLPFLALESVGAYSILLPGFLFLALESVDSILLPG